MMMMMMKHGATISQNIYVALSGVSESLVC